MASLIVRFAVDPDALAMESGSPSARRAAHARLIRHWHDFGILVHEGADCHGKRLSEAIGELPQELRKMWKAALAHNRRAPAGKKWRSPATIDSPKDLKSLNGQVDLVCFHETRAELLGMPEDTLSWQPDGRELRICRLEDIDQSDDFLTARRLSNEIIEAEYSVEALWEERFEMLASVCRHVTVVDRYAVQNHILFEERGEPSGLRKLLSELDESETEHSVTVYSAIQQECSEKYMVHVMRDLAAELDEGGLSELSLYVTDNQTFGGIVHHRYLRFNGAVCILDTGIQVLGGETVNRTCLFQLLYDSRIIEHEENELRRHSSLHVIRGKG
jgi:hypothetical protein